MYICDRCQMGYQVGMNVSHSHRRTKTKSIPNLHVITVKVEGQSKTMRLCTKCTRIIRKNVPTVTEEVKKTCLPPGRSPPKLRPKPQRRSFSCLNFKFSTIIQKIASSSKEERCLGQEDLQ